MVGCITEPDVLIKGRIVGDTPPEGYEETGEEVLVNVVNYGKNKKVTSSHKKLVRKKKKCVILTSEGRKVQYGGDADAANQCVPEVELTMVLR